MKNFSGLIFSILVSAFSVTGQTYRNNGNYNQNGSNNTIITKSVRTTNHNYNGPIYIFNGNEKFLLDKKVKGNRKDDTLIKMNPSVLVIPKASDGQDIYESLNEPLNRIGIAQVIEKLIDSGFSIVSYPDKSMLAKNRIQSKSLSENSQAIYLSGADICLEVQLLKIVDGEDNSVSAILSAYNRNDGSFITQSMTTSNAYNTSDFGLILDTILPELSTEIIKDLKRLF